MEERSVGIPYFSVVADVPVPDWANVSLQEVLRGIGIVELSHGEGTPSMVPNVSANKFEKWGAGMVGK